MFKPFLFPLAILITPLNVACAITQDATLYIDDPINLYENIADNSSSYTSVQPIQTNIVGDLQVNSVRGAISNVYKPTSGAAIDLTPANGRHDSNIAENARKK